MGKMFSGSFQLGEKFRFQSLDVFQLIALDRKCKFDFSNYFYEEGGLLLVLLYQSR